MHGVCLHPDRAVMELKVRAYNRTTLPQTFLWWANAGIRVHEAYQSFFPPDVHYVADHALPSTWRISPLCEGQLLWCQLRQTLPATASRKIEPPDEISFRLIAAVPGPVN